MKVVDDEEEDKRSNLTNYAMFNGGGIDRPRNENALSFIAPIRVMMILAAST